MMDRTDRHYRYFFRCISKETLLYTEMIHANAILHGDRERLLGYSLEEKPLALQLGGDNPQTLAACAKIAEEWGYDEVNINVGCPSERVQHGSFGACLMADPQRVADCVSEMRAACSLPVTVKHRIGIDHQDKYEDMNRFVSIVKEAGCDRFSVHARAAWLKGLSPKENREIPPLRYEEVHRLKREHPDLIIEINGGITSLTAAREQLSFVDAVMIGRAAYDDPYLFAVADEHFFGASNPTKTRAEVVESMASYVNKHVAHGGRLHDISRHMLGLFAHQPKARSWRRVISTLSSKPNANAEVLRSALAESEPSRGRPD
jgi:tRNA-dihydrouridine synthase A